MACDTHGFESAQIFVYSASLRITRTVTYQVQIQRSDSPIRAMPLILNERNRLGLRRLGFKFVDFLYKSSDVCHIEIKMISSENIFFTYHISY